MVEPQESRSENICDSPSRPSSLLRNMILGRTIPLLLIPSLAVLIALLFARYASLTTVAHTFLQVSKLAKVTRNPEDYPEPPFTLFSSRVVLPQHLVKPAYVIIDAAGKIEAVKESVLSIAVLSNRFIVDVSPFVVMPGLIDPHVHVNEPGRTSWEGYEHASRAAAAGGTTTILDMPLNNVPSTIDLASLVQKIHALSSARPIVDVGVIGGVIPGNIHNVEELLDGGVLALKSFMVDSQSKDFPNLSKEDFKKAVAELHRVWSSSAANDRMIPYILHAELDIAPGKQGDSSSQDREYNHESYDDYEASRPAAWEVEAIRYAAEVANNSNVHIHIAHVSAHEAVDVISELRYSGSLKLAMLTAETCPQYLLWAKEELPPRATLFKCSPPIRSAENRERLVRSTFVDEESSRVIDLVASDHSPCPPELKSREGNISNAWGGISGLQYRLQGSWTAASTLNVSVVQMTKLLSEGPARVFGIDNLKGFLKAGLDADIVVWDPEASTLLTESQCHHRHKASPFHGLAMRGAVIRTLLRGRSVFNGKTGSDPDGPSPFGSAKGRLLVRSPSDGAIRSIDPKTWQDAVHHP